MRTADKYINLPEVLVSNVGKREDTAVVQVCGCDTEISTQNQDRVSRMNETIS